ncbi:unnamed protein product [Thlaspi arvense]|uniref:Uncharacterized protein n=1 Tax=Thlaspi arvense TaxID=13288 RepID=A0AAU9SK70_THLAR|nr:unnamed protein product [Thlaspi arvense]
MQLGKALNLKGFSITVAQGTFNGVGSSLQQFSGFQFVTIPESLPDLKFERLGPVQFLMKLNKTSEASIKNCIAQLLLEQGNDIACIVYDELMYVCGDAANEFNIPSIIFSTTTAAHKVCCSVLSKLNADKFLIDMEDHKVQDKVVENLHPLTYKDLPTLGMGPLDPYLELCREIINKRTASAVIINTSSCLVSLMAATTTRDSSKQRSVIYISFGTVHHIETKEMLEMAWGICNSNQPFLWVIRQGSESLPEEVREMVSERGYIVTQSLQKEVLAHPAVGGFWSHCGWNSTLESILEGMPIICRPFVGEQKLNAKYIESVWRIGMNLEGGVERGGVERAVKRLIVDEEGAEMRERALVLKEKLKVSVRSGGSSYNALDELVKMLKFMK